MKRRNINIKEKIKAHFYLYPTAKLRVRQIEKELKLPLPSVIRYVKELTDEGFLKKSRIGNVVFYSADRTAKAFLLEKRLFNIKSLHNSGLVDFLVEELSNPAVVLFGSYSKGEDIESSDIDLYVETPSKKEVNLEEFEKVLKRKIEVLVYKSIDEIKNKDLTNNIINGIMVNGFVEAIK
ncbi:MAG TPA: nucleotidyltransferase domain-containing protein [Candidatus Nanoarchaeia archaeon]|nr:nucleotidyltransferase domain-containing protein [Candidatus Nanoarchaeia archaeon]